MFRYLLYSIYWLLCLSSIFFVFHVYCHLITFISWYFISEFTMLILSNYFRLVNWIFSYVYYIYGGLNTFVSFFMTLNLFSLL